MKNMRYKQFMPVTRIQTCSLLDQVTCSISLKIPAFVLSTQMKTKRIKMSLKKAIEDKI